MDQKTKNLKINSMVLIVFAICDLVYTIGQSIRTQSYSVTHMMEITGGSRSVVLMSIIITHMITALCIIAYLFMGIKGLSLCNGKSIGKAPGVIAKIFIVINIIMIVCILISIPGTDDLSAVISSILEAAIPLCFLFPYMKGIKAA